MFKRPQNTIKVLSRLSRNSFFAQNTVKREISYETAVIKEIHPHMTVAMLPNNKETESTESSITEHKKVFDRMRELYKGKPFIYVLQTGTVMGKEESDCMKNIEHIMEQRKTGAYPNLSDMEGEYGKDFWFGHQSALLVDKDGNIISEINQRPMSTYPVRTGTNMIGFEESHKYILDNNESAAIHHAAAITLEGIGNINSESEEDIIKRIKSHQSKELRFATGGEAPKQKTTSSSTPEEESVIKKANCAEGATLVVLDQELKTDINPAGSLVNILKSVAHSSGSSPGELEKISEELEDLNLPGAGTGGLIKFASKTHEDIQKRQNQNIEDNDSEKVTSTKPNM